MAENTKAGVTILVALIGAAAVIGAALIPVLHKDSVPVNSTLEGIPGQGAHSSLNSPPVNRPTSKAGTCSLPGDWILTELAPGATQGIDNTVELDGNFLTMNVPARQNGMAGKLQARCAADEHAIITGPLMARGQGITAAFPVQILPDRFDRQQDGSYMGELDNGTRFILHNQ